MLMAIVFCLLFALLNRARGSWLFNLTDSTEIGRIVSMFSMAMITYIAALLLGYSDLRASFMVTCCFAALMLWCSFGWDAYWSAEIGNDPDHSKLWGLARMALRQCWGMICIVGLAIPGPPCRSRLVRPGNAPAGGPLYRLRRHRQTAADSRCRIDRRRIAGIFSVFMY